jgi:hypothetical protein
VAFLFLEDRMTQVPSKRRSVYILATDIDVACDRVKPLSAQARLHDVDDLAAALREQFGGMAVLLSLP